jgi:hypothetical protein
MEARVMLGVETRSHMDGRFQEVSSDRPWQTSEAMDECSTVGLTDAFRFVIIRTHVLI